MERERGWQPKGQDGGSGCLEDDKIIYKIILGVRKARSKGNQVLYSLSRAVCRISASPSPSPRVESAKKPRQPKRKREKLKKSEQDAQEAGEFDARRLQLAGPAIGRAI